MKLSILFSGAVIAIPLICIHAIPQCPECGFDEHCEIIPQSNESCSTAICVTSLPPLSLTCPKIQPYCTEECGAEQECKVFPPTEWECPRAACVYKNPSFMCIQMIPFCEDCGSNEFCKVFPATREECSRAACVLKPSNTLK
jgi:hypothetical protein